MSWNPGMRCREFRREDLEVCAALMGEIVSEAERRKASCIYLLTERGDSAEQFYAKLDFRVSPKMILRSRRVP